MRNPRPYRVANLDPDYRRDPKTADYCERCQRDLAPGQPRRWIAYELDTHDVIHPEDFAGAVVEIRARRTHSAPVVIGPVGLDCARRIGLAFTWPERPEIPPHA